MRALILIAALTLGGCVANKPNVTTALLSDTTVELGMRLHRAELQGLLEPELEDRLINYLIDANKLLLPNAVIPENICAPTDTPITCRAKILQVIEEALYNIDKQRGLVP